MQDIKRQLEALYYLRDFILDFRGNLLDSVQVYNSMVSRLKEVGIPREIAENYEANYYTANIRFLLQIVESFSEVDIKYIDANIYAFEQLLDEAAGTSNLNKVAAFNKGTENIKRKMEDESKKTITKECLMCHRNFETIFAGNNYCPICFKILLDKKDGFQHTR